MERRRSTRGRDRGGEGIPSSRTTLTALGLGLAAVALAAGAIAWLTRGAGHQAGWPVVALGAVAMVTLVLALAVGRPEPLPAALGLIAAAYVVLLVLDNPPLDGRAVVFGAVLITIGELSYLSVELRGSTPAEPGVVARRVGWIAMTGLGALGAGGVLLALADGLHTGGVAAEAIGVAAALGAVGLLVIAVRSTVRSTQGDA